jgi:CheY-like chemotaxis protein
MADILLIDPDEARREFVWASLEQAGYTVISTGIFADGQILLRCRHWDALLIAADADEGSGLHLARIAGAQGIRTLFLDPAVTTLAAHPARQTGWLADLQAHVTALARQAPRHSRGPAPVVVFDARLRRERSPRR